MTLLAGKCVALSTRRCRLQRDGHSATNRNVHQVRILMIVQDTFENFLFFLFFVEGPDWHWSNLRSNIVNHWVTCMNWPRSCWNVSLISLFACLVMGFRLVCRFRREITRWVCWVSSGFSFFFCFLGSGAPDLYRMPRRSSLSSLLVNGRQSHYFLDTFSFFGSGPVGLRICTGFPASQFFGKSARRRQVVFLFFPAVFFFFSVYLSKNYDK